MDLVLGGLTWDSVLVYIDETVVYAHTYSDLKLRLEEVFIRLRGAKTETYESQTIPEGDTVSGQPNIRR